MSVASAKAETIAIIRSRARFSGIRPGRRPMLKQFPPDAIALHYFQRLKLILKAELRLVLDHVKPQLEAWEHQAGTYRGDSAGSEARQLFEHLSGQLFREFDNHEIAKIPAQIGRNLSEYQREQLGKQIRSQLSVDVVKAEPWLQPKINDFVAQNVALIKTIPQRFFAEVEQKVQHGIAYGRRPEEIDADIQERYRISEYNAKRIAKDQSNKFFGQLNKLRQNDLGVSEFIWATAEDERVREEHEILDGKTFPWNQPPAEGLPGEPVLCRCVGEPNFRGIVAALS